MTFKPRDFFDGLRYVGRVRAVRATYHVYDVNRRYLLMWPSRRSPNSYFMSEIPHGYVEAVRQRFRGRTTTSVDVRRKLRGPAFRQLGALLVLVARGEAKINKTRIGRSLAFRLAA